MKEQVYEGRCISVYEYKPLLLSGSAHAVVIRTAMLFVVQFPAIKDVRVHAPITCIKLGIPIYFIDHSEFITLQCKKILSRANNEIKCSEFSSIKRALRPHLRTIIAV